MNHGPKNSTASHAFAARLLKAGGQAEHPISLMAETKGEAIEKAYALATIYAVELLDRGALIATVERRRTCRVSL